MAKSKSKQVTQEVPEELTTFPLLKEKVEVEKVEPKFKEKKVIVYGLNVREAPSFGATVVNILYEGAKVTVYGEADGWVRIGDKQWVCAQDIG